MSSAPSSSSSPTASAVASPGEILRRIEAKGYTLAAVELREATAEILAAHYAEHEGKPFYGPLVEFMLSGPVLAVVIEGQRCIEGFRSLAGATDPTVAAPGTIRGDLGRDWGLAVQQNLVHGSDSEESAAREIGIWFPSSTRAHSSGGCGRPGWPCTISKNSVTTVASSMHDKPHCGGAGAARRRDHVPPLVTYAAEGGGRLRGRTPAGCDVPPPSAAAPAARNHASPTCPARVLPGTAAHAP